MEQNIDNTLNKMSWKEYSDDFNLNDVNDGELEDIKSMLGLTEEKAIPNPLDEIDNYIDLIGKDISKAVGNLSDADLRA